MKQNPIKKEYTKEYIQNKIKTDDRWMIGSLLKVYLLQTESEKLIGQTSVKNGVGFSGTDGSYLSYVSRWVMSGKPLNDKHKEKIRSKLPKYWKQIQDMIIIKQSTLTNV